MNATLRARPSRALLEEPAGSLPPSMRMRQSLAQFEEAFREEAAESIERRERLRKEAAQRSRVRRVERTRKQGSFRFAFLALTIIATAVVVTVVMFETLAMLAGG
jgi:anti-sigma-K factor RskA